MPNKEKLRDKVVELAKEYNSNRFKMDELKERNQVIKDHIIATMSEIGEKSQIRDNFEVKYTIPKSFDLGMFKMENSELSKKFLTTKTITETIEEFDLKTFKKTMPDTWEKYRAEGTPRLTVKYHVPQDIVDKIIEESDPFK